MHTMRFSGGTSVSGAAPCGKYTTTEPSSVMLNHCAYSTADDCACDRADDDRADDGTDDEADDGWADDGTDDEAGDGWADDCACDRPCGESDDRAEDASPAQVQAQTSHVASKSATRGRMPGNMAAKRAILRRMPAMLRPGTLSRADSLATWPGYL